MPRCVLTALLLAAPGLWRAPLPPGSRLAAPPLLVDAAAAAAAGCYEAVSVGGFHGLTLASNTSQGFGEGGAGQLNIPPSTAGLTLSVAAGGFFSCALHRVAAGSASTSVACWGAASAGVTDVPSSVSAGGGPSALAAGGYHACAVLASGGVSCWGANAAGQVSPLPIAASTGVATIALGSYHSCLTKQSSGAVACWGRDDRGQVSGLPGFLAAGAGASTRLACGGYHCCAWGWGPGGSNLTCWGASAAGQTTVPASVSRTASLSLCAGGYFSCALQGGTVTCWGGSTKGETAVPPAATGGDVASLACGWYGVCAVKSNGSLVCWGGSLGTKAAATLAGVDLTITTGAGSGGSSSGALVLSTGTASSGGNRGAISLSASAVVVNSSMAVGGNITTSKMTAGELTLGSTTLTEATLQALLALAGGGATPSVSASPTPSATASASASAASTPSITPAASSSASQTLTPTSTSASYTATTAVLATGFNTPYAVAFDFSGNVIVATVGVQTISRVTPAAVVTVVAGNGNCAFSDGVGTAAAFCHPTGVAVSKDGSIIVADRDNSRIRRIFPNSTVTTLAGNGAKGAVDGVGTSAAFFDPSGVAADASGTFIVVADSSANRIRKVTMDGVVTTLALGSFNYPCGVALDRAGNVIVADSGATRISKVSPSGAVTILAGTGVRTFADGVGTAAAFNFPYSVATDSADNVWIADTYNHRIRKMTPSLEVSTAAGGAAGNADGVGSAASFNTPYGIAVMQNGSRVLIAVADTNNWLVRLITIT